MLSSGINMKKTAIDLFLCSFLTIDIAVCAPLKNKPNILELSSV